MAKKNKKVNWGIAQHGLGWIILKDGNGVDKWGQTVAEDLPPFVYRNQQIAEQALVYIQNSISTAQVEIAQIADDEQPEGEQG